MTRLVLRGGVPLGPFQPIPRPAAARSALRVGTALVVAGLLLACAEQRFRLGFESDTAPPTVAIVKSAGDPIDIQATGKISFTVQASDNLGLKTIAISIRGGLLLDTTITFTSAVTSVSQVIDLPQGVNSTVGGTINITATSSGSWPRSRPAFSAWGGRPSAWSTPVTRRSMPCRIRWICGTP
ncbi:MAG: hypothetical protein HYT81_09215 [Gemmatimonadetes bacterium]|nr:hypothetical protein [Gemmatimonadota bacterium]